MSLEGRRATFPPGKRRRSCVAETCQGGKYDQEGDGNHSAGVPGFPLESNSRQVIRPVEYSSSFDLGMTQPGSLDTWRRSSEKSRLETDQQRVSHTAGDVTSYRGTGDCSGMADIDKLTTQ